MKQRFLNIWGFIILLCFLLIACKPTIQKQGGLLIILSAKDKTCSSDELSEIMDILNERLKKIGYLNARFSTYTNSKIKMELPNPVEPEKVREQLLLSYDLGFRETYDVSEISEKLLQANELFNSLNIVDKKEKKTTDIDSSNTLYEFVEEHEKQEIENQNLFNFLMPSFISVPKGPLIGLANPEDTTLINRHLNSPKVLALFPKYIEFRWSDLKKINDVQVVELTAIKGSQNNINVLSGKNIKKVIAEYSNYGSALVNIQFDEKGSVIWEELTRKNIGRAIAITLNDVVLAAPIVQSVIIGGNSQIAANFSIEEANVLALNIKTSKLPELEIVSEAMVGPN